MKCFYHPETDAVGICKNCNRGLCTECAVDVGNALACKNRCEERTKAADTIVTRNIYLSQRTGTSYSLSTLVWIVMGLLFFVLGINAGPSPMQLISILGGVLFAAVGVWVFLTRSKMPRNSSRNE